jgi:undecaprenyl-diphosphatase
MLLGLSRQAIVEFSFLLAIPTMLAATGLDLWQNASSFSRHDVGLLSLGFITAFIVALIVVRWFIKFIQRHSFKGFALYRILLGIALLVLWYSIP